MTIVRKPSVSRMHQSLGGPARFRHPLISRNLLPLGAHLTKGESNVFSWNPADKSIYIDLSGDNLTATAIVRSGEYAVRANKARGAEGENWYFEVLLGAGCASTRSFQIGLMTSEGSLATGTGKPSNCAAYDIRGYKYLSGAFTSITPTSTQGDVISVAWSSKLGRLWWAKNGVWMQSGDPANDINPMYSTSSLIGERYPAVSFYGIHVVARTSALILRLRPSDFSFPPPARFRAWNRV